MLLDTARAFFEEAGWACEEDVEAHMLRAFHDGDAGAFAVYVRVDDEREQLIVYGVMPDNVDEGRRVAVGALLAGLNYGLPIGSFEIDFADGEVRFRAGVDVEGGELTPAMVRSLASACVINLDLYRKAIEAVAGGAMGPLEALSAAGG
jgi:hypothetical protein